MPPKSFVEGLAARIEQDKGGSRVARRGKLAVSVSAAMLVVIAALGGSYATQSVGGVVGSGAHVLSNAVNASLSTGRSANQNNPNILAPAACQVDVPCPPSITASATANGGSYSSGTWTKFNVVVHFTCTASSGATITQDSLTDKTVSSEGANQSVASNWNGGVCKDNYSQTADAVSFTGIDIDKTAPTITDVSHSPSSPNGTNGWYTSNVTETFHATDSLSGLNAACASAFSGTGATETKTTSTEGTAVTLTSDGCTDAAGNAASGISSAAYKIDKADPTVTDITCTKHNGNHAINIQFTTTDANFNNTTLPSVSITATNTSNNSALTVNTPARTGSGPSYTYTTTTETVNASWSVSITSTDPSGRSGTGSCSGNG